ncbi:MAG: phage tail protein [Actinomycetota bacterium]
MQGLPSPVPLGEQLPAVYLQYPGIAPALTQALDEVLAPVFATLDNFVAYLDPMLTPEDFVDWLAGWMGVEPDETWSPAQRRAAVARASAAYRRRGTVGGIAEQIELATGVAPEIADSGGVNWSGVPGGTIPGNGDFRMTVRLRVPDPSAIDTARVEAIVREMVPANVVHEVEVVRA